MRAEFTFRREFMTLATLRSMRTTLLLDPHYQRQGSVWPRDKQQLFIDSLMNGFLIPPMYWHVLNPDSEYYKGTYRYAVIDGRQRLETILAFLAGEFALSPENSVFVEPDLVLTGVRIDDLRERIPWLYADLLRQTVEVVLIESSDIDLIEELFSRLNEGVPLKAAEKRNRGRVLAPLVRGVAETHEFFKELPFGNVRYRHLDLLAKFMRIEDRGLQNGRVPDLKKSELDRLFTRLQKLEGTPDDGRAVIQGLLDRVERRLDRLSSLFGHHDPYLGSVGMVTIYYVFDKFLDEAGQRPLARDEIRRFEGLRASIKRKTEADLTDEEALVSEFATYAQGPTSGSYLSARLRILASVLRKIPVA